MFVGIDSPFKAVTYMWQLPCFLPQLSPDMQLSRAFFDCILSHSLEGKLKH